MSNAGNFKTNISRTSLGLFFKGQLGVTCLETIHYIACMKEVDNATTFLKSGLSYDDQLVKNSDVKYIGKETHDSVSIDCLKVIPKENYINEKFKEFESGYGNKIERNFKLCYSINDGVLRFTDGVLTVTSQLSDSSKKCI